MICPHCSQEHPDGARFCPISGLEIPQAVTPPVTPPTPRCPRCGQEVQAGWAACGYCGLPLGTGAQAPAYAPPSFNRPPQPNVPPGGGWETPGAQPWLSPTKKRGVPRWAWWVGGAGLVLVALLVVALVLNLPGRLTGSYDAVAETMPADTDLYVGINLLEALQMEDASQLAPFGVLFGDALSDLDTGDGMDAVNDPLGAIDRMLGEEMGFTLRQDVLPWVGQYAGVALTMDEFGEVGDQVVFAIEARDTGAADDFLAQLANSLGDNQNMDFTRETVDGVALYVAESDDLVFGRNGRMVLFGPSLDALSYAIREQDAGRTLGDNPMYSKLAREAPSGALVRVYLDSRSLREQLSSLGGFGLTELMMLLSTPVGDGWQGSLLCLALEDSGPRLDTISLIDPDLMPEGFLDNLGEANDLIALMPQDALGVFSGGNMQVLWERLVTSSGFGPEFAEAMQDELGINPDRDLFNYLDGPWVFGLIPANEGLLHLADLPGLGFAWFASSSSTNDLQLTAASFNNQVMLPDPGFQVRQYTFGDGQLYEAVDVRSGTPSLAYGAANGYLVVGPSSAVVDDLFARRASLTDTENYRAAQGALGNGFSPALYVNARGVYNYLSTQGFFDYGDQAEIGDVLARMTAITSGQRLAGRDVLHERLVLLFAER